MEFCHFSFRTKGHGHQLLHTHLAANRSTFLTHFASQHSWVVVDLRLPDADAGIKHDAVRPSLEGDFGIWKVGIGPCYFSFSMIMKSHSARWRQQPCSSAW